jgi:hypothetical protein
LPFKCNLQRYDKVVSASLIELQKAIKGIVVGLCT